MKILSVGAEFSADRRTHVTKLLIAFRSFAIAPKKKPGKPDSSGAMKQPLLRIPSEGTALGNYKAGFCVTHSRRPEGIICWKNNNTLWSQDHIFSHV
jgi:hypothetical protein